MMMLYSLNVYSSAICSPNYTAFRGWHAVCPCPASIRSFEEDSPVFVFDESFFRA